MDFSRYFRRQSGCLLLVATPYDAPDIDEGELMRYVKQTHSLMARYFADSQVVTPPH